MNLKIYALYDKKSEQYGKPIFSQNDKTVTHSVLLSMLQHAKDDLTQFPEDYTLYRIGGYDCYSSAINSHEPVHIIECIQIKEGHEEKMRLEQFNRDKKQQKFDFDKDLEKRSKDPQQIADDIISRKNDKKLKAKVQAFADNNGHDPLTHNKYGSPLTADEIISRKNDNAELLITEKY